jgi:uncharacterized membrane protein YgaE (UPF0421/DUF939 family)
MDEATPPPQPSSADQLRALEGHVERARKLLALPDRMLAGLRHAILAVTAAIVAYMPTHLLGFREAFWAAITAIAVLQTELGTTQTTARDQCMGAFIGGLIGTAVALLIGETLVTYIVGIVLSILTCWTLNVASAARLSGTTATIILLVPHQGVSPEKMLLARVSEVACGVTSAVAIVWLAARVGLIGAHAKDQT